MKYLRRCGGWASSEEWGAMTSAGHSPTDCREGAVTRPDEDCGPQQDTGNPWCLAGAKGIKTLASLCFCPPITCWGLTPMAHPPGWVWSGS